MNYILVVDDSLLDRRAASEFLRSKTKYQVEYASNGLEALELIEERLPMAVVTDLQMPEMDGMQLTEEIRRRYATVPVILMTGHGSEEIAVQALMCGAADYVLKSRLQHDLHRAVESVLALKTCEQALQRIAHCLRYQEFRFELENNPLLVPPLVAQLEEAATASGAVDPADRIRVGKSLVEALLNAIYHGNMELTEEEIVAFGQSQQVANEVLLMRYAQIPYRDRHVDVRAVLTPDEARFVIRDDGCGFDTSRVPNVKSDPSSLIDGAGRGLVLICTFMDEVSFNACGNEITMVKRRQG